MTSETDDIAHKLKKIEIEARERCAVSLDEDGVYTNVLKGCYIKSLEFAAFSRSLGPGKHAFFAAPTLRGICEDYIALRYLRQAKAQAERDSLLKAKVLSLVSEAAAKQKVFFEKRRSFQPVFTWKGGTPPKGNLPPTRSMAATVQIDDLYDFVYAVTSDVVHFNPRVIVRNAWGSSKVRFDHSVSNFDVYYADFCQTYGLFFLTTFTRDFAQELSFSEAYLGIIAELEEALNDKLRWPEAVTFEEMNMKDPGVVVRLVLQEATRGRGKDA